MPLDKSGDWDQLRINAHSLKPQAEFMGILSLKNELIKIEEAVKLNDLQDIEGMYTRAFNLSVASEQLLREIAGEL